MHEVVPHRFEGDAGRAVGLRRYESPRKTIFLSEWVDFGGFQQNFGGTKIETKTIVGAIIGLKFAHTTTYKILKFWKKKMGVLFLASLVLDECGQVKTEFTGVKHELHALP